MSDGIQKHKRERWVIISIVAIAIITIAVATYHLGFRTNEIDLAQDEQLADTPAAPAAADVFDGAIIPTFDVVRVSRSGTGVIAGRAAPNAIVEVYANDNLIGTVVADSAGEWVMIPDGPLESGSAEMSIIARSPGQDPIQSKDIIVISVPERADDEFVESQTNGVVAVLTPRDGSGPSRIMQRPGSQPVGEVGNSLALDTIDYDDDGIAMISGRALPRATIAVYIDNDYSAGSRADDDGRWTATLQSVLRPGDHVLRIDQIINGGGDVQLRIEQPFNTEGGFDAELQTGKVVVQSGNSLWHIARRIYGSGNRYTLIFQENGDQIRDPDLIYPGQLFDLPGYSTSQPNNN